MRLRTGRHLLKWLAASGFVIVIAGLVLSASPKIARTAGPLNQRAYVWQRAYAPAVTDAIRAAAGSFDQFIVLAAEVSWRGGKPQIVRVNLDFDALKSTSKPIGFAIRIGSYAGPFDDDSVAMKMLCALSRSVLADAKKAGLCVSELQIDFDCAESKLAGYQQWIQSLRPICASDHLRLTITSLPSWLGRSSFASLVADVDGFVLQVHSFQPPSNGDFATLCDRASALDAVEQAARLGRPFQVALPTYSYIACFDAHDKVLGISAEGPLPRWPAGARLRLIRSDETDIASLVRDWTQSRPSNLTGIIWYRLPVAGDVLNWRSQTLAAVMAGRAPAPKLIVLSSRSADGATEFRLANEGDADALTGSTTVVVESTGGEVIAADALGMFELLSTDDDRGATRFRASDALAIKLLAPGDSILVGWVRTTATTEAIAHVETKPR